LGYSIGIGLNGLHLIARLSSLALNKRSSSSWWHRQADRTVVQQRLEEMIESRRGIHWSTIFSIILILTSFANAYYTLTRWKTYSMFTRKLDDPIASTNAKIVRVNFINQQFASWSKKALQWINRLYALEEAGNDLKTHQLNIWNPSALNLRIIALYPPLNALMWHFLDSSRLFIFMIIMTLVLLHVNVLIYFYDHLVKDRILLSAEVMREYDKKLVHPRLFAYKRNIGVDTSDLNQTDHNLLNKGKRRSEQFSHSTAPRARHSIASSQWEHSLSDHYRHRSTSTRE